MADNEEIWLDPADYTRPAEERVWVTPELASWWLSANTRNRKVREEKVTGYANAMKSRAWVYNGETIKLSRPASAADAADEDSLIEGKSVLIDGQHRLLACEKSGLPFETLVVFGLPPEAQETTDIGTKRLFSDTLKLSGEVSVTALAAALRLLWMYENGHRLKEHKAEPSPHELQHLLKECPQIRNSVAVARPLAKMGTSDSVGALAHLLFSSLDRDKANEFFDMLIVGVGFSSTRHPVYVLREWFQARRKEAFKRRITREYVLVMYIKAWNHFIQGNEVGRQYLRWVTSGPNPESFPKILDPREQNQKNS